MRIITETETLVAVPYIYTTLTTVTLPGPYPTDKNGQDDGNDDGRDDAQGRGSAADAKTTGIPFDYTCRRGDSNEKYPGGMSLEATNNQKVTLCKPS